MNMKIDGRPESVQALARMSGLLYLVIIVIGLAGEAGIRNTLVVGGDPQATALNIIGAQGLWRLGVGAQDVLLLCAVAMTWTWYLLLRPVHPRLALLLVYFALVSLAVEAVSALHLHAVLTPLSDAAYLQTIPPALRHWQAYQSVVAHAHAFGLALIFFGVECIIAGYLIYRSGYLPRTIGVLMQIAGVCYLINSFSMIVYPPLQDLLFPFILLPSLVGESAFCLCLLIRGVNLPAWQATRSPTRNPPPMTRN